MSWQNKWCNELETSKKQEVFASSLYNLIHFRYLEFKFYLFSM